MRTFDLSPLFRNSVGFDRMTRLLDGVAGDAVPSYPPYNIEKTGEGAYRITMAVAGFSEDELDVQVTDNQLTIAGRVAKGAGPTAGEPKEQKYLHRGIAERAFERRFNLADHIKVADASLVNGLLHVELVREVPEAMKPRTVSIKSESFKVIGDKAA